MSNISYSSSITEEKKTESKEDDTLNISIDPFYISKEFVEGVTEEVLKSMIDIRFDFIKKDILKAAAKLKESV